MKIDKKNKIKNNSGFTLIEVLFSISIFIIILFALTSLMKDTFTYNSLVSEELTVIETSRNVLRSMVTEIRTAEQAETGAYIIDQATNTSFSFYSDINNDGLKEKTRYFLDNGSLKKGVIIPTGIPFSYNATDEVITTVASYLTNSSIFYYYDENYDGTTNPLSSPINVPLVRLVKIILTIDKNPNKPPASITTTTQVSIRNLKDNL